MLTVPEAARRVRCNPETVRRWIRAGRLPSRRAGTQHLIEESDLLALTAPAEGRLPAVWRRTATGEPMPAVVHAIHRSRDGR
jgi:excisionase family DNA binding protein